MQTVADHFADKFQSLADKDYACPIISIYLLHEQKTVMAYYPGHHVHDDLGTRYHCSR